MGISGKNGKHLLDGDQVRSAIFEDSLNPMGLLIRFYVENLIKRL